MFILFNKCFIYDNLYGYFTGLFPFICIFTQAAVTIPCIISQSAYDHSAPARTEAGNFLHLDFQICIWGSPHKSCGHCSHSFLFGFIVICLSGPVLFTEVTSRHAPALTTFQSHPPVYGTSSMETLDGINRYGSGRQNTFHHNFLRCIHKCPFSLYS